MGKWAFWGVAGFLGCSLSLSAQTTRQTDLLALNQSRMAISHALDLSTLNCAYYGFPAMTLLDGRPLSLSSARDWIEPVTLDFLPAVGIDATPRIRSSAKVRESSGDEVVTAKPKFFDYVGGEVGVLYGHSVGGKFSREVEQGYILGEMGNDTTHITVGASYERSSGRRR